MNVNEEQCWQAVVERDATADGTFVYAVRSTGIYCRPSCPSRRPKRQHVVFFEQPAAAEGAAFRPCLRCEPQARTADGEQVAFAQQVCRYIEEHLDSSLTLETLSMHFHRSPYHLQRTFKHIMGVTPRQYAEACRLDQLKAGLRRDNDVTSAAYDAGYGSSSRIYERTPTQLGMTPATYRKGGAMQHIRYTVIDSPLGRLLIATTTRGICAITLGDDDNALVQALHNEYPAATIERDDTNMPEYSHALIRHLEGEQPHINLPLDLRATAFQWRVWEALRAIPYGSTCTYSEVAQAIGQPTAARAVARACATNRVALAIPCHRVVREDGSLGGYRWGIERKQTLLAEEAEVVAASASEQV